MASTSRGSRQSDGVAQGLERLANAAAAASSPARQTDHSSSTNTPPRSITASNEGSAVSGLSVRGGASVGATSTPAKRTAPEEPEYTDESPSPKKKHPDFSCDKSFISGDSAGWAGKENEVRLGPPPQILDIGPNRRSTEALACLAPPPRLQANDTMQNKSPRPLSGALTTLRSLPYIKAEAKRRQEEKGEPSVARTCLLSLLDLAKIHLLLFTAVCITEEARRRAE